MSFASLPPILARELTAHARSRRWAWGRSLFAGVPLGIAVAAASIAWEGAGMRLSGERIGRAMQVGFRVLVAVHMVGALLVSGLAAPAIAGEKDRRTLDFLLATRLGNAEIVLSKLAACLIAGLSPIAAAFPLMLLMVPLGGIDPRLVALTYAAVATTALFLASVAIFVSTAARDGRRAASSASGLAMLWLAGPFVLAQMLPRLGLRLPDFLSSLNALLMSSSPLGILAKLMAGPTLPALIDAVGRMCGLQLIGSVLMLVPAILRLRSAYRVNTGGDGPGARRIAWRVRRRPAVGDDPIVWREKYTLRARGLSRLANNVIWLVLAGAVAFGTHHFARPALAEVRAHGYASGPSTDAKPEFNLMVGLFATASDGPIDRARMELNTYLRILSFGLTLFLGTIAMSFAMESITVERAKETWPSLIGTPLTGRAILKSKIVATLWRLRAVLALLAVLWMVGMIAGALYPLGVIAAGLGLAAWVSFFLAIGVLMGVRMKAVAPGNGSVLGLVGFLPWTVVVPFLWPSALRTVLLGAAAMPFTLALSLISWREARIATRFAEYPPLRWVGLSTGEGVVPVVATCAVGIVLPAVLGVVTWRYAVAHFDRLVGRPWRESPAPPIDGRRPPV